MPQFRVSFGGNWGREYKICREHPRLPSGSGWARCLWKYYANVTVFSLGERFNWSFQHLRSLETKGAGNDKCNLFTMGIKGEGVGGCSYRWSPLLSLPAQSQTSAFPRDACLSSGVRGFQGSFCSEVSLSLHRSCILYSGMWLPQARSFNFWNQSSKWPDLGKPRYKYRPMVQTWKNLWRFSVPLRRN